LERLIAGGVSGLEHCQLPRPSPIDSTSPSFSLGECLLRTAYASDSSFESLAASTRAARLGTACHQVLEAAGRGRLPDPSDPSWRIAFEQLWTSAISRQEERAQRSPLEAYWGPAASWPNYAKRKVATRRLCQQIGRLREPAETEGGTRAGSPGRGIREERQSAFGGKLVGKADVIVRGPEPVIEDYKTGALYEPDDPTQVKEQYRAQMLLYAVLEHEATGIWPVRAILIPLEGLPVEIEIVPAEAEEAARQALADLARYNNAVEAGGDPSTLAAPSPEACFYCPYAIECPAFWTTADPSWRSDGVAAVAGEILGSQTARNGTLTLELRAVRGSAPSGNYLLYGLDPQRFAVLANALPGTEAAATWLAGDEAVGQLRPTSLTRVTVATKLSPARDDPTAVTPGFD
jgi:RecB family exonuclease